MNKRALALPLALAAAIAWGAQAVFSEHEQTICADQGGCLFITTDTFKARLKAAFAAGVAEGKQECRKPMT